MGHAASKKQRSRTVGKNRILSALFEEGSTGGVGIEGRMRSWCALKRRRRADRLAAQQDVDDDHGSPAVRTDEGRLDRGDQHIIAIWLRIDCGRYAQQLACLGEVVAALGIGDQSVVARSEEHT